MNTAFYGHNRTAVALGAMDGKFFSRAHSVGIKGIEENCKTGLVSGRMGLEESEDYDQYHRDYYETAISGKNINSRHLGHREGTTPNDFYYAEANPGQPTDMLIVLDEGFGGPEIPAVLIVKEGETRQFQAALMLTHGGAEGTIIENTHGDAYGDASGVFARLVSMVSHYADMLLEENDARAESGANIFDIFLDNALTQNPEINPAVALGGSLRTLLDAAESFFAAQVETEKGDRKGDINIAPTFREWPAFPIPLKLAREGGKAALLVPDNWTVTDSVENKQIYDVAFDYVQRGAEVIEGLPRLSFGALTWVDRWEIEAYQNIRNLILDYSANPAVRPLSIAVFGAPGSGKSFGVTQIAENMLPGRRRS